MGAIKLKEYKCPACGHITNRDFDICPACGYDNVNYKDTRTKHVWTKECGKDETRY